MSTNEEQKKINTGESLEKLSDWYIPSSSEKCLLEKIIVNINKILANNNISGTLKWCNIKKAYVRVPYGKESKVEVLLGKNTFSIPVSLLLIDKNMYNLVFSIKGKKYEMPLETSLKHGFINANKDAPVKVSTVAFKSHVFKSNQKSDKKQYFGKQNNNNKQNNSEDDSDDAYDFLLNSDFEEED